MQVTNAKFQIYSKETLKQNEHTCINRIIWSLYNLQCSVSVKDH